MLMDLDFYSTLSNTFGVLALLIFLYLIWKESK